MKMTPQSMEKETTIPEVITFELKKGKSYGQKITKKNGTARRASLPTLPSGFGTDTPDLKPHPTIRRSTMPQVTQEMKNALPPLHELATLLMPPTGVSRRMSDTMKSETTSDNVNNLTHDAQNSME